MSEVKIYEMFECAENRYVPARKVVSVTDFDRVTADAERLRAELECSRGDFAQSERIRDALQALLTAADERNGQLKLALKLALPRVERKLQAAIEENFGIVGNDPEANRLLDVRDSIEAALKP